MARPRHIVPAHGRAAFTLVELMVVAIVMVIIVVAVGVSLTQATLGPAVQTASGQVAGGMTLARQIAISKGTPTRFIIANTNGPGLPAEPFRYWSIISSNKNVTGLWVMEKEWEALPVGAVFLNIAGRDYSTLNWDAIPTNQIGRPYSPKYGNSGSGKEWEFFSFATARDANISYPDNPDVSAHTFPSNMPFIGFNPMGAASSSGSSLTNSPFGNSRQVAVRITEGTADPGTGTITLRTDKNATYIETDNILGKVIVRPRESYRNAP